MKYVTDISKLTLHNLYLDVCALSAALDRSRIALGLKPLAVDDAERAYKVALFKYDATKQATIDARKHEEETTTANDAAQKDKDTTKQSAATAKLSDAVSARQVAEEAEEAARVKLEKAARALIAAEKEARLAVDADERLLRTPAENKAADEKAVKDAAEREAELLKPLVVEEVKPVNGKTARHAASAGEAANEAARTAAEKKRRDKDE